MKKVYVWHSKETDQSATVVAESDTEAQILLKTKLEEIGSTEVVEQKDLVRVSRAEVGAILYKNGQPLIDRSN